MPTLIEKLKNVVAILQTLPNCRPVGVGGSVRDAIIASGTDKILMLEGFEKSAKDFDLELFGDITFHQVKDALAQAGIELELVGKSFPVYKVKGWNIDISFPRTEQKTGDKHIDFAINVNPRISFAEAALRRDFTVNAIGYDWNSGKLLDPYNGLMYINAKVLHPVSNKFVEDALRVLRAFKFIGRLGFKPSTYCENVCSHVSTQLTTYAHERLLPEWIDFILNGKPENVIPAFRFFLNVMLDEVFPEIGDIEGVPQHQKHHPEGDVFNHTMFCLEYFMKHIRHTLADDNERIIVGFAVLTHDFGKATCTTLKDGLPIAYGHEESPLARQFLTRLFDNADERVNQIEKLVKAHMRPVSLCKSNANLSAIRRLVVAVDGRMDRLLALVECDQGGRPPKPIDTAAITWIKAKLQELSLSTTSQIKPLIQGRHLMEHLKLKPGPIFKVILTEVFEAQLDGKFNDETTGINYLISCYRA